MVSLPHGHIIINGSEQQITSKLAVGWCGTCHQDQSSINGQPVQDSVLIDSGLIPRLNSQNGEKEIWKLSDYENYKKT